MHRVHAIGGGLVFSNELSDTSVLTRFFSNFLCTGRLLVTREVCLALICSKRKVTNSTVRVREARSYTSLVSRRVRKGAPNRTKRAEGYDLHTLRNDPGGAQTNKHAQVHRRARTDVSTLSHTQARIHKHAHAHTHVHMKAIFIHPLIMAKESKTKKKHSW